jgi:hypothetical protein
MALGDQSKALIIMSKMKGWDPTVIPGVGSIANFNKAPNPWELGDQSVGTLPEGIQDSYPQAEQPRYDEAVTFNVPELREDNNNRGGGSDPYAGMGGM